MFYKNFYYLMLVALISFWTSVATNAHEMWIEPLKFSIQVNENILAHERVGENFKGNIYAYLASSYESFDITSGDNTRAIKSRLGDIPAVNEIATEEGLVILSAISSGSELTYDTREKFEKFIRQEGLEWVFEAHKKRGLPEKGFTEVFRRYPKSLVKVGHGKGEDRVIGLPLEWVIETNPYSTKGIIKGRLLWQGEAFQNAHVTVFNKPHHKAKADELTKTELVTDKEGRVEIPRGKGGLFLINAVRVIEPSKETVKETGAVWESLWASVTYELKFDE